MINIAYIVLTYDEPELLRRVAKALEYGNDRIFVHVDKKSDISQFVKAVGNLKNVTFIKDRVDVYWGGFNSIVATMNLYRDVLQDKVRYDRIILLQGKDYPLYSPTYLHSFFEERMTEEFCKAKNITKSDNPHDYMKCFGYWSLDGKRTLAKKLFNKVLSFFNTKVKIKYRRGCYVVGGVIWNMY